MYCLFDLLWNIYKGRLLTANKQTFPNLSWKLIAYQLIPNFETLFLLLYHFEFSTAYKYITMILLALLPDTLVRYVMKAPTSWTVVFRSRDDGKHFTLPLEIVANCLVLFFPSRSFHSSGLCMVIYCSRCFTAVYSTALCVLCSTTDTRELRRAFELLKLFSTLFRLYSRVF